MKRVLLVVCSTWLAACSRDALPLDEPPIGTDATGLIGCGTDPGGDPQRVVLASVLGPYGAAQSLLFVRADGSNFVAATFGAERTAPGADIYIGDTEVLADRGFVLATRGTDGAVLFDPYGAAIDQGASRAELREALRARGLIALLDEVDGYRPIAAAAAGGAVPLVPTEGPADRFAWWDRVARRPTPRASAHPFFSPDGQVQWAAEAFVYVGRDGDAPIVVAERADAAVAAPLPGYDASLGRAFYFGEAAGAWILLHHYDADRTWRFNLRTGAIVEIEKRVPGDLPQFNPTETGSRLLFGIDAGGGLLDTLRTPEAAALYRSDDGQTGWERVTSPVREISTLFGTSRGGTYWARASRSFYPTPTDAQFDWSTSNQVGARRGPLDELVRRDSGVAYRFAPNEATILDVRPDGSCAALRTPTFDNEGILELLEVTTGRRTRLGRVIREHDVVWLL